MSKKKRGHLKNSWKGMVVDLLVCVDRSEDIKFMAKVHLPWDGSLACKD